MDFLADKNISKDLIISSNSSTSSTCSDSTSNKDAPAIDVKNVTMAYGDFVVMNDLNFSVNKEEVFVIMGGSGCGKSTLLRTIIGLQPPAKGEIFINGENFSGSSDENKLNMLKNFGVMYQGGALWTSMTLAENVAMPIEQNTNFSKADIDDIVRLKLSLVGLRGFENYYPSQISGGMKKRAGIARAMALDPQILFLDEPSAGLDPISSKRLDDLILELRADLKTTIVVVTHELYSIFSIADRAIFLDTSTRRQGAIGDPNIMKDDKSNNALRLFLNRGEQSLL